MTKQPFLILLCAILCGVFPALAQKNKAAAPVVANADSVFAASTLGGLKFRAVGPALTSGRISDFAVNPANPTEYYVAVSSGGVWKTVNGGTTYEPIFDGQASYSIGCVALDPNNPNTVWVGTGENNNQRSVAYGDGVYRSLDGGKSWKNMGLKTSEHIAKIIVHPHHSDIVYVAATGPLWSAGGERGVYKTTDGGKTWKAVLTISEHTGIADMVMDPNDPNTLYASAHQRRRHVFTYISGGPESAIYKSTDGGDTWRKVNSGLPSVDLGRIGLAVSPANSDVVYAIVEAAEDKSGFYRSTNRGERWEKMSSYSTSGNYYQEIICDPKNVDRVFSMNTFAMISNDGGKSFQMLGEKHKHVDNHALWINPNNTDHLLIGCDGGIYETWDLAKTWHYKPNLSVTQFYKVAVDNAEPFYNIYGGTQDNFSLGGPSRTTNVAGIVNDDWFVTNGGDGFESQVDPVNPNIVYAQAQYGWIVRFDKQSGEAVGIKPQEGKGEPALRWNWDAPLLISPHSPTRLYFSANKVFRSDDRGNTWKAVSPDLTRQIDRNQLPVMGKVWSMDAVAKNESTSIYGNIVAFDESPKKEGLLYVGTDDGLIQVTENGGDNWRKLDRFPGVPERTYVNMVLASQHSEGTLYAAFNNHKNGDFKPYLLKSTDKGATWTSIAANLPARGSVYSIAEDHVDPNLLFVGTEFGLFVSTNGGKWWTQMKAGLPPIAIRDIAIQRRENDLVLASFGRGFFVLDDYSPLRGTNKETLAKEAHIFPIKDALQFVESRPMGLRGKSFMGESYFTAENPPVGAVFTYYLKNSIKTLKEIRQEKEQELAKKNQPIPYPTFEEMRAEDSEEKPFLVFTVTDEQGKVVRRLKTDPSTGIQRIVWDFRTAPVAPISLRSGNNDNPFSSPDMGYLVVPGKYFVQMSKSVNGQLTDLTDKVPFQVKPLNNVTLPAADRNAVVAFQEEVSDLRRDVRGAASLMGEMQNRISHLKIAVMQTPDAPLNLLQEVRALENTLAQIERPLLGDNSVAQRQFETYPAVLGRVEGILDDLWMARTAPTTTQRNAYQIAKEEFAPLRTQIAAAATQLANIEQRLAAAGAPWTPGRALKE